MDPYRLFVYSDDGRLVGPGIVIHAINDNEAIAQAEAIRGYLAAELFDLESLAGSSNIPTSGSGAASSQAAE